MFHFKSRWGGGLANTRGFGDAHYKALGVFAEPALSSRILKGSEYAFVLMISDGVTDMLSDQEIVDLARGESDPAKAAKAVVQFAESIGACVLVHSESLDKRRNTLLRLSCLCRRL